MALEVVKAKAPEAVRKWELEGGVQVCLGGFKGFFSSFKVPSARG